MKNEQRDNYISGNICLVAAVLLMTVLPLIARESMMEFNFDRFKFFSSILLVMAAYFYFFSIDYFKKQLYWIASIFIFYYVFQAFFFKAFNNLSITFSLVVIAGLFLYKKFFE